MELESQPTSFNSFIHTTGQTIFTPRKFPGRNSDNIVYSLKLPHDCDLTQPILFAISQNDVSYVICETKSTLRLSPPAELPKYTPGNDQHFIQQTSLSMVDVTNIKNTDETSTIVNHPNIIQTESPHSTTESVPPSAADVPVITKVFSMANNPSRTFSAVPVELLDHVYTTKTPTETKRSRGRPQGSYSQIKDVEQTNVGFKCSLCGYLCQARRMVLKHRKIKHANVS